MDDKTILLECKDCGEVFLGDDLCDGCMCPICESGLVIGLGIMRDITIKEIEKNIKVREKELEKDKNTIARAKKNGLIRTYRKRKNNPLKLHNLKSIEEYAKEKPPLGLIPRHISEQQRREEILEAMTRYNDKDKVIPEKWIDELWDLREHKE